eukprot:5348385-Pleurochrysis_carterae.AAC.1
MVPTSSGGRSHASFDAVHAHKAHAQRCRRRAAGRATHRSTLCKRTRRMHKGADVERRAEPHIARRCACAQGACTKVP